MKLPGADYRLYSLNANLIGDARSYHRAGLHRFIYETDRATKQIERQIASFFAYGLPATWEFTFAGHHWAESVTEQGSTRWPIWRLNEDSGAKLRQLAKEYPRVFVHVRYRSGAIMVPVNMKEVVREMWEVVNEFDDTEFIYFGSYRPMMLFGYGFTGGAVNFRFPANKSVHTKGTAVRGLILPNGENRGNRLTDFASLPDYAKEMIPEGFREDKIYISILLLQKFIEFFREHHLNTPRDVNYKDVQRHTKDIAYTNLLSAFYPMVGAIGTITLPGDMTTCNYCSLAYACRLYQEGSVCTMPSADGRRLAALFQSRNTDDILTGMGEVLGYQADMLQNKIEVNERRRAKALANDEADEFEDDEEIRPLSNDLIRNGERVAKLINPQLGRPQINVHVGPGQVELRPSDIRPAQLAQAARELEASGTPREEQTTSALYRQVAKAQGATLVETVDAEVVDGVRNDF